MDEHQNPLLIHPSDQPGLALVTQPLTGDNYNSWNNAMTMALIAKNKLGFVDHSIPAPPVADLLYSLWRRNDRVVASWILNSVAKDISASILCSSTTAEIWHDLQVRFKQHNGPRFFQLKKDLMLCTQGSLTVTQYFTKLKAIWEELGEHRPVHTCHCGGLQPLVEHLQHEYVISFLMGLNDVFSHIRGQVLVMNPKPSINEVFSLVVQEEQQREVGFAHISTDPQLAFAVHNSHQKNT